MNRKGFTEQIKKFRLARGLDRHEFAAAIGKGYLTVAKWETGKAVPSDYELYEICYKFNTSSIQFGLDPEKMPKMPAAEPEAVTEQIVEAPEAEGELEPDFEIELVEEPIEEPVEEKPLVEIVCSPSLTEPTVKEVATPEIALETEEIAADIDLEPDATVPDEDAAEEADEPEHVVCETPAVGAKEIKAYEEKKERYEKYVRLSSSRSFGVKLRRLFAWIFDVAFTAVFCLALAVASVIVLTGYIKTEATQIKCVIGALVGFVLGSAVFFSLRDLIFGGRSLGKRIFCLRIADERSGKKALVWQRIFRNFFNFPILNFVTALFSGRTVSDRIVGTVVVSSRKFRAPVQPKLDELGEPVYDIPERPRRNHSFLTVLIALVIVAALAVSIMYSIDICTLGKREEMKNDEYQIAVSYLVGSEELADLNLTEEDVDFLFFVYREDLDNNFHVSYVFHAEGGVYVAESDDGVWTVCNECTYIK